MCAVLRAGLRALFLVGKLYHWTTSPNLLSYAAQVGSTSQSPCLLNAKIIGRYHCRLRNPNFIIKVIFVISMCGLEYHAIVTVFKNRKKIYLALSVFLKIKMYEMDYMADKAFVSHCHL